MESFFFERGDKLYVWVKMLDKSNVLIWVCVDVRRFFQSGELLLRAA